MELVELYIFAILVVTIVMVVFLYKLLLLLDKQREGFEKAACNLLKIEFKKQSLLGLYPKTVKGEFEGFKIQFRIAFDYSNVSIKSEKLPEMKGFLFSYPKTKSGYSIRNQELFKLFEYKEFSLISSEVDLANILRNAIGEGLSYKAI